MQRTRPGQARWRRRSRAWLPATCVAWVGCTHSDRSTVDGTGSLLYARGGCMGRHGARSEASRCQIAWPGWCRRMGGRGCVSGGGGRGSRRAGASFRGSSTLMVMPAASRRSMRLQLEVGPGTAGAPDQVGASRQSTNQHKLVSTHARTSLRRPAAGPPPPAPCPAPAKCVCGRGRGRGSGGGGGGGATAQLLEQQQMGPKAYGDVWLILSAEPKAPRGAWRHWFDVQHPHAPALATPLP